MQQITVQSFIHMLTACSRSLASSTRSPQVKSRSRPVPYPPRLLPSTLVCCLIQAPPPCHGPDTACTGQWLPRTEQHQPTQHRVPQPCQLCWGMSSQHGCALRIQSAEAAAVLTRSLGRAGCSLIAPCCWLCCARSCTQGADAATQQLPVDTSNAGEGQVGHVCAPRPGWARLPGLAVLPVDAGCGGAT